MSASPNGGSTFRQSALSRISTLIVVACSLLVTTACGGSDDGEAEAEAFTVNVEVEGFDQTVAHSGEEAVQLTVPFWKLDLSNVELVSSTPTTWSVEPESAVVAVIEDTPTRRVVSLAGMRTGDVTFIFRDTARNGASEARVRMAVEVQAQLHDPKLKRGSGETFEWQRTVALDGNETKSTETWRVTEILNDNSYVLELVGVPKPGIYRAWYTQEGNLVKDAYYNTPPSLDNSGNDTYIPSSRSYDFPLFVGKVWSIEHTMWATDAGDLFSAYGEATVQARESVTVPAGTYDSLRVFTREVGYWGGSRDASPERTCWWSIELGTDVRCVEVQRYSSEGITHERIETYELSKYTRPW